MQVAAAIIAPVDSTFRKCPGGEEDESLEVRKEEPEPLPSLAQWLERVAGAGSQPDPQLQPLRCWGELPTVCYVCGGSVHAWHGLGESPWSKGLPRCTVRRDGWENSFLDTEEEKFPERFELDRKKSPFDCFCLSMDELGEFFLNHLPPGEKDHMAREVGLLVKCRKQRFPVGAGGL